MKKNLVTSLKACHVATKIPINILKLCKHQNAPGFNANQTINLDIFLPWYNINKDAVQITSSNETLEDLKKELARRDMQLKDLKIKKLDEDLITTEELKELLIMIATSQSVILKRIMGELPPKVAGKKEEECKLEVTKCINEVFAALQDKIK